MRPCKVDSEEIGKYAWEANKKNARSEIKKNAYVFCILLAIFYHKILLSEMILTQIRMYVSRPVLLYGLNILIFFQRKYFSAFRIFLPLKESYIYFAFNEKRLELIKALNIMKLRWRIDKH
jgi:hypothetical protein